jgi:hypothetical protein
MVLSQNFSRFCHIFDIDSVTSSKGWGLLSSMSPIKVLTLLFFLLGLGFLDLRMVGCLWGQAGRKDGHFCFENSSHQKLTWREPVLQRGGSVQEKSCVWILGFFQQLFDRLNASFRLAITLRVTWGARCVDKTVVVCELAELRTTELGPIISDDNVGDAVDAKHALDVVDGVGACEFLERTKLHPTRVVVDYNEKRLAFQIEEIHPQSAPWTFRE